MSRALDRHRIAQRQSEGALFFGDDGSTAETAANALAELTQGVGKLVAKKQADDAAKKKAADDAAKQAAASADLNAALADLKAKQKTAAMAHIDAQHAMLQADAIESDKNGPQHVAARQLTQKAALADADVQAAQAKVAFYQGGGTSDAPTGGAHDHGAPSAAMPMWAKIALGIAGAGFVGFVGYKLARR